MPPFPTEISASIICHLADDQESLQRAVLVSREFCFLAQEFLFSTISIDGNVHKLFNLERVLLSSPRSGRILQAIRTLTFINTLNPFYYTGQSGILSLLQLIADRAHRLRAIHFGPFGGLPFDWNYQSDEGRSTLIRLFTLAEELVIEGISGVPLSLFPKFKKLKSLDIAASSLSKDTVVDRSVRLPSPQSLAVHTGILDCRWWNMAVTLSDFKLLPAINFSSLNTLYLHAPLAPGRNALYRDVIALCDCKLLKSLRFYISLDDEADHGRNGPVIDLSRLTSLQSLFIIVNVEDSLACMAKIVDTLTVPQTHLKELALFIETSGTSMEEDRWMEDVMVDEDRHSDSWKALDQKIGQILDAFHDTLVFLQLPPVDPIINDETFDFVYEQLPGLARHMHKRFHILDFNFRNIVMSHISFRDDADQARILEDFAKRMGRL